MEKKKRRWGDRKDGVLLRDLDGMHFITPLIYPNRCDNEAYIRETIDLTNMNAYLKKKNETETEFPYTMFHLIVAALVKTITLRPKMNRFIANKNFYQRNEVSMSFVVKKQFADEAAEALAVIHAKDDSDVDSIHEDLRHQILDCKDVHKVDSSTDSMDFFNHMPRWLGKFLVWILTRLDIHGWIPASIIETDPYYTTCVISNLGSIKLNCGYHHLTNWVPARCSVSSAKSRSARSIMRTARSKCARCWIWVLRSTSVWRTAITTPRPSGCSRRCWKTRSCWRRRPTRKLPIKQDQMDA